MEGMNTTLIWILIAIVVIALIIVGIVVIGNSRKKSKTISFDKPADQAPKELTQQEKSGNYQAKGGFAFAPAEVPEPVRVDNPVEPAEPAPGGSTAMSQLNEQLAQEPVAAPEPEIELSDDAADAVEKLNDDVVEEGVEKPAVDGLSEDGRDIVEEAFEAEQDPEEDPEAEEAASIAAVTAEVADAARQEGAEVSEEAIVDTPAASEPIDEIAPAAGRIGKLRGRLSRSQNAIGQGLLGILTAGDLDEDAWEEIEDTLIMADLGTQLTLKVTESLRAKIAERGVSSEAEARAMLREALIEAAHPEMDRSIKAMPNEGKPAVILVVGVNGTGKTTTTGKLARVLVSMGHSVVLGAADTFRAAAADQLETWGRRVGASTVRGKEGADPASVAFDAVATGVDQGADVVLVDTAGRLHTATGLMDQLGKVRRVVEKKSHVDEVLLVLDATVGQNGITQARVFREVVNITGVVLTKLDGTAKGGIVFQVQEELGVPVKLVGLGEGADDLAPFEVESFVDALLG
ncbi:signal recognition particle-docking protein FtsY [Corynebacterium sanguinis]|uniref:Signal recognition particle receptor FtsY n=2 Tax=Corynebacterium sanguinis TaxID=2594913 RepID=A0A6C1TZN9_9CORY|nr:signal recognition particle-docking protein FtsY [Corynebacterium sanguinis]MCT1498372.1 signal recognition particle-docking protein FtsY [Corynebacterium sanguinis]TVS30109.1 signal recognition particle-docking protein FtsY [Corynebacterium sanguinis]